MEGPDASLETGQTKRGGDGLEAGLELLRSERCKKTWVEIGFKANFQGNPEREFLSEIRVKCFRSHVFCACPALEVIPPKLRLSPSWSVLLPQHPDTFSLYQFGFYPEPLLPA